MEDKKGLIKSKKQMFIVISVFALVMMLGTVTYAFFNYTRTGALNNLGTGQIYFNTTEGPTLNLTNLFPMTSEEAGEANLDSVSVVIEGNTTYSDGEEYEITLVDVNNTVNGKSIPLNYTATYTPNTDKVIGTPSADYWNAREDKDANVYTLNSTGVVKEGEQVLVGYVDNGETGIEGTLTIKAYIDADRIAISDTYYGNATATPTPTAPNDMYGTTTEWVNGRTVFTTEEWNSLNSTPISFKIKAVSQEGIWVEKPDDGTIESCPGCKYLYTTDGILTTWNMAGYDSENNLAPLTPTVLTSGIYDNYEELIATTGKNYFLGVKLNNNNEVTNAYACGVKDDVPFCIEGEGSGSKYIENQTLLQSTNLYNNTCVLYPDSETDYGYDYVQCGSWDNNSLSTYTMNTGTVYVGVTSANRCAVHNHGLLVCDESNSTGG